MKKKFLVSLSVILSLIFALSCQRKEPKVMNKKTNQNNYNQYQKPTMRDINNQERKNNNIYHNKNQKNKNEKKNEICPPPCPPPPPCCPQECPCSSNQKSKNAVSESKKSDEKQENISLDGNKLQKYMPLEELKNSAEKDEFIFPESPKGDLEE